MTRTQLLHSLVALMLVAIIGGCAATPTLAPTPVTKQAIDSTANAPATKPAISANATPAGIAPGATPASASGLSPQALASKPPKNALVTVSFLADIAQNVAGNRYKIDSLIPAGTDPHTFEPTPADAVRVANSDLLIVNGAGLEEFLEPLLKNSGQRHLIEAAAGIPSREHHENEASDHKHEDEKKAKEGDHHDGDPHFWLDPNHVVQYADNLQKGLSNIDPEGVEGYIANARAYSAKLKELDSWISEQIAQLPQERRLLVTNHESFGYFADRYGFRMVGAIIPSVGTGASPSAQQMAQLIDQIKKTGARAIFLETGANPQLAQQIARETGVRVVTTLFTHSITPPGGDAPTYIDMMRYNTRAIVDALK